MTQKNHRVKKVFISPIFGMKARILSPYRQRCLSERGYVENKRWGEERLQSVKSAISCRWTVKPWRPYKANTPEKESPSLSVTLQKGNVTRSKWRKALCKISAREPREMQSFLSDWTAVTFQDPRLWIFFPNTEVQLVDMVISSKQNYTTIAFILY